MVWIEWVAGMEWVDGNKKRNVAQLNYGSIFAVELDMIELDFRLKYIT